MTWTETTLGAVAPFSYGKSLPQAERKTGTVPVYGSGGITGFHNEPLIEGPACVIGRKGSVGRTYFSESPSWPIDTTFYTHGSSAIDLDYLYFLLQTLPLQESSDSAVPGLNRDYAHSLPVRIPSRHEQERIAKILKSLEQKIRINLEISETLEKIAQTIFKSWFIDFDPVHAKALGEEPEGMDAESATFFPDSFEDSELGSIPSGWTWGTLADFTEVIDCLHSKKPSLLEQGFPYLQLDTISDSGVLRFDKAAMISEQDYKKWTSRIEASGGDCLITNVGRVGAVSQVPDGFQAAIGRNITAIRPKKPHETKTFLISLLTSQFMKREISIKTDSGTILDALNVRSIPGLRCPIPQSSVLRCFEDRVGSIWSQMHNLYKENVILGQVRDSLLPRLISGELEIPEELLGE